MRILPPAVAAARAARVSTHAEILIWIEARNRETGLTEVMGLWTGDDHHDFIIGGETRTYYGAGNILQVPEISAGLGLDVRTVQVGLAAVSPEVEMAIRGYDVRLAPVQLHRAEFDVNGNQLGPPERLFKGWVNGAPIVTPAEGGAGSATLELVSNARILTRHGGATKSDQVQRRRGGCRFRRWATLTQSATVYWGEEKFRTPEQKQQTVKDKLQGMF